MADSKWFLAPTKVFAPPSKLDRQLISKRGGDSIMEEAEDQNDARQKIMGDAVTHYKKHIYPASHYNRCNCTRRSSCKSFSKCWYKWSFQINRRECKENTQRLELGNLVLAK